MESDEQHDAGIHQPIGEGGIATPEQVPVGQRVVEVPGDQYGVVRLAAASDTTPTGSTTGR